MLVIITKQLLHNPHGLSFFSLGLRICVDVLEHEIPKLTICLLDRLRHLKNRSSHRIGDDVMHVGVQALLHGMPENLCDLFRHIVVRKNASPDRIIHVMVEVCNLIRITDDPSLQCRRPSCRLVVGKAVQDLPCQIQPLPVLLQNLHKPHRLLRMVKALRTQTVQHPLTGMPKRRMSKIMPKRNCLRQVLVEPQRLGDRSRILRDLQRMRHPRPVMIPVRCDEHLRLVLQSSERLGMQNPVPVSLKHRPQIILRLLPSPAPRLRRKGRPRRKNLLLALLKLLADQKLVLRPRLHHSCLLPHRGR